MVTAMFPPTRTGTSFYSRNLALALTNRAHQVRVVTLETRATAEPQPAFPVERLAALHLPLPGVFNHFRLCSLYPSSYRAVRQALEQHRADVVLLVNHYLDIAFPAIYAARAARVPLICSVGTQLQSANPRRNAVLRLLDRMVCGTLVFPFCDRVIAWDSEILRYLRDVQGERVARKTVIVNYGVNGDLAGFLHHQHDYRLRHQLLGVGAVSEQRSFVPLVRAFAEVAPEFPALRLKIIGHVYYDEAVRVAASLGVAAKVEFAGERPHADVLAEMAHSDALFASLTSKYLGLGTATIESMLMGLPTLVNTPLDLLGGARLADMQHIVHCPDLDPRVIAARLRALLHEQPLRERVGRGGRAFVLEHMNWQRVAADMERVLSETVRGRVH